MKDSEMFTFIKGFKDWTKIKTLTHELNYHIMIDGSIVYLFFQESNGKKDWKDNLNFLPIPCRVYKRQIFPMFCHRGFVKEYKSGNDEIMAFLIKAYEKVPNAHVIISGWSNGAAMATLAAEDFHFRTGYKPEVVTFGNPKVCFSFVTAKHVKASCSSFREYCNNNDIVTYVPPVGWHVNKKKCGDKFNFFKLFNPQQYHTHYDEDLEK